jgi:hypothetical protein
MAQPLATRFDAPFGTDDEFCADLIRSEVCAREVALILLLAGLDVHKRPLQIRPDRTRAADFSDGGTDLFIGPHGFQVKERTGYPFSGPWDFPFSSAIFDTSSGFDRFRSTTAAYLLYSPARSGLLVVPASAYHHRTLVVKRDGRYGHEREFVALPIQHAWSAQQFIDAALQRPECRR